MSPKTAEPLTRDDCDVEDYGELPPDIEQLRTVIAESQAQAASGEVVPANVIGDVLEDESDEERELGEAIAQSDAELARGEGIPAEQVLADIRARRQG